MTSQPGAAAQSRRKVDLSAPASALAKPAAEPQPGSRRGLARMVLAWISRCLPKRDPPDVRATLSVPFFENPGPSLTGYIAFTVFCARTVYEAPTPLRLGVLCGNLVLLAWRLGQLRRARRHLRSGGQTAILPLLPGYMLVGCLWSGLNGLLCGDVALASNNTVLWNLATAFATGAAAGISSHYPGAPIFAAAQIVLWLLPTIAADLSKGGLHLMLAAALVLFGGIMATITRQMKAGLLKMILLERTSAALAARFDAALSNMSQGLVLYDKDGALRVINRRFFAIFGLQPDCVSAGQRAPDVMRACLEAGIVAGKRAPPHSLEAHARDAAVRGVLALTDGRFVAVSCEQLPDGGSISTYEDITERRANEARIAHMAMHDALTGMPNRVLFRDRLDQAVARLTRGESFALACLDLDHFKAVNDTLGHNMGDKLLQAVATRLACCVREVDLVARLGGDEFALLLPGLERAADALMVARRVIETVRGVYVIDGARMTIGVSIGIALAPQDGSGADALMMHADLAMYAAKADGRGGARVFESDLSMKLAARQSLERELAEALEADQLELLYAPIHCTRRGVVTALQAVASWPHPTRGRLDEDEFMPQAQDRALQAALGAWRLRVACAQAAVWPAQATLVIRLSPAQLRCGDLLGSIPTYLTESGLAASRLEIEIQETAAVLDGSDSVLESLETLRDLGVRVAVGDFGAGLSCLARADRLAFDKIRIGAAFVEQLDRSENAAAIVRAILGMGTSLGLATAAQGARSEAHVEMLRALGCEEAQGHVSGTPRTQAETVQLLASG